MPVQLCRDFIEYHKQNTEYKSQGAIGTNKIPQMRELAKTIKIIQKILLLKIFLKNSLIVFKSMLKNIILILVLIFGQQRKIIFNIIQKAEVLKNYITKELVI